MTSKVYNDLREQLDQYSVGFPSTPSGTEMKILEKLFTEDEARLFLNLSLSALKPQDLAERTGGDVTEITRLLDRMTDKGLVFRLRKGDSTLYSAAPFVVGFYEYQVKDMDQEFAALFEQYFQEAMGKRLSEHTGLMRSIPVNQAIEYSWPVVPYEDAKQIFKTKDRIAVARCICRVQQGLVDKGCGKPEEVCFMFGSHADYYVDRGMGRWISTDEAVSILDMCEEAGLVPQPYNSQNPGGFCNCCGDCCAILRSIKLHPRPVEKIVSNYYAEVDAELCSACETCMDRCQMDAISIAEGDAAVVNPDRCIGCGLCVTTCPSEAMSLKRKVGDRRREPPEKNSQTLSELAKARGTSLIPLAYAGSSKTGS